MAEITIGTSARRTATGQCLPCTGQCFLAGGRCLPRTHPCVPFGSQFMQGKGVYFSDS